MISEKPWVAHIEDEINNLVDLDPRDRVRCSIFRVPPSVRKVKPHLYSPQIVPFGLYNIERIRNEKMTRMDKLKLEVASVVLKIIKAPYTECYQHYDAALDCLNLPRVTPNQLHPILSDLVSSLSRLPYVSRDSEGKLEMMRGRIAHLKAMAHAPGYELRERESRLLSADLDSVFQVFARFLELNSDSNRKNWKWLCNKVVGDAAVMEIYDDVSGMYEGAARSLLTLDSVFLVGFMLSLHSGSAPESRIRIEELGWFNPVLDVFRQEGVRCNAHVIGLDMWLMENQIPLSMIRSALECMWEVSNQAGESANSDKVLNTLVRNAIKGVLHLCPGDCSKHTTTIDAVPIFECKHLLECLYRVVCPSVKTSSRQLLSRRQARIKTPSVSAAELAFRSRGDGGGGRISKVGSRSMNSVSDAEARYPTITTPPPSTSSRSGHPILAPSPSCPNCPRVPPGLVLYPPAHSSSFPGFHLSPPSSPTGRERESASGHNKQYDQVPYHFQNHSPVSPLMLAPPPLPGGSPGGYHVNDGFSASCNEVTQVLANGETREMDRYGRSNGLDEPATPSGWHESTASPVGTDDELELPFRSVRRSPSPLPVSDVMDDGMNQVEFTFSDTRASRNNSYSTVTIDIPSSNVAKRLMETARANNSTLPVSTASDGSAGYVSLDKLRSASMTTIRTFQSARGWLGAPWRLVRRILARGGGGERKLASMAMYGSKGAAQSRAVFAQKAPVVSCTMPDVRITPVPTVTQLRKAGIKIRSGSQVGCKLLLGEGGGCGVIKPTLFLPKLEIDDNTERILHNLVAFELVSASEHELMSYLHFMNGLIKTEEDVQLLQEGKKAVIWIHPPSNEFEVITMFGNLLQNCYFHESSKSRELRRELTKCYNRSWRHWCNTLTETFCSRSWILISLIAATLLLVVLQTAYMLLGFYRLVD